MMNCKPLTLLATLAVLLIICCVTTHAANLSDEQVQGLFAEYARRYNKQYDISDMFKRYENFKTNLNFIIDWNNDKKNTHQVGVNFFADMSEDEMNMYRGLKAPEGWKEPDFNKKFKKEDLQELSTLVKKDDVLTLGDNVDFDLRDQLGAVRNQGSCGSCYSWSAVTSMEGFYRMVTDDQEEKLPKGAWFSPQQGVDCTGAAYGCYYCQGGWPGNVMKFFTKTGVCNDADYPYVNRRQSCRKCEPIFLLSGSKDLSGYPESALVSALSHAPVTVALVSAARPFMFYKSGIISDCQASSRQADHAVTLVGAHVVKDDDKGSYVLIRNSWGPQWGEQGYVRLAYGKNVCKWRSDNHIPLANPGPAAPATTTPAAPATTTPAAPAATPT